MKIKFPHSLVLSALLVLAFSFQSCEEMGSSGSTETTTDTEEAVTETTASNTSTETSSKPEAMPVKHSEMTPQQHSTFVAKHVEHILDVDKKMIAIKNENTHKKDQYSFECENGKSTLERHYNEAGKIQLLTFTKTRGDAISAKHHFFEDGKLIYQMYHHEVKSGEEFNVDDHKTFFKDGEMLKCLEKKYSFKNGDPKPAGGYKMADCTDADKLTDGIDKLIEMSEEDAKAFLCK